LGKCNGCGETIHFLENPQQKGKWLPYNEDNSRHYCGSAKKEFTPTTEALQKKTLLQEKQPFSAAPPTERGAVTLSQREWTNLREQIVAIHMQLSEITQTLKALLESRQQQQEPRTQVSGVKYESDSIEDQINAIDFDQMFSENNPS
jgi:hypothetical protein